MYGESYGVSDFVVLSVVEVCVDYGGVNVFHVCLFWRPLWCWCLGQCMCCCMLLVSYVSVLFVVV